MAVLSKLLETSLPFRCYEIAHPWEPSCTASWVTLFFDTFSNSIKLYGVLYLVSALFFFWRRIRCFGWRKCKSVYDQCADVFASANSLNE